jgi:tetratricopeptide (TPR) repeat protein
MNDIFISYKREEQPTARKLADALEREGWTVWWDPKLRAGEHFDEVIEEALNEAQCVIVLWSERSVQSRYVRDEATYALEKNKLMPVALESVNLPFRFRGVHTPNLFGWDGSNEFSEFRKLVEGICTILEPRPAARAESEEGRKLDEERSRERGRPSQEKAKRKDEEKSRQSIARNYPWRAYGLVAAAVAAVLVVFSFVLWPKPQGPAKHVIILVADFDGPEAEYGVTARITNQLRQATKKYDDIEIQGLKRAITEQDGSKVARTEGEKRKADIVIWGWYRTPGEVVPVSVNFEVLQPPKALPELGKAARGSVQQAATAELKSFTLQTRLSEEMSYLTLFVLGMARRSAGDGEGAIARFNDALGQTTEPSSSLNQSLVYFFRGLIYLTKGNFDYALADVNQAIALQPALARAYVNRGLIYIAKGDWSRSLADLNQALQLKPELAEAYNNRGLFYLQAKDYDRAITDFSQALRLLVDAGDSSKAVRPDSSQLVAVNRDRDIPFFTFVTEFSDYLVYINRGVAYLGKGDHDRAFKDFNDAIKQQPSYVLAYFNRAAVYFTKEDYDRALADLAQTIKLQPEFALAYLKRGSIYYVKGDSDRALAEINHAIKLEPNSAFFYSARGEVYAKRDDYDRAIADFNQAIKLQPTLVTAYLLRAGSYLEKGDDDRSFADYNRALQLAPDNADAYNGRGWTYAQKGEFDHALRDLDQALKLKPEEANFYDSRGFIYAGKGEYEQAMADYNQALKLKPHADYAYYHRGVVYRTLGDREKAIVDFNRTLELTKNTKRKRDAEKQLRELGAKPLKK